MNVYGINIKVKHNNVINNTSSSSLYFVLVNMIFTQKVCCFAIFFLLQTSNLLTQALRVRSEVVFEGGICEKPVEVYRSCLFKGSPVQSFQKGVGLALHSVLPGGKGFRVSEGCRVTLYASPIASVGSNDHNKALLIHKRGDVCADEHLKYPVKTVAIDDNPNLDNIQIKRNVDVVKRKAENNH